MNVDIDYSGREPDEIADLFEEFDGALEGEMEDAMHDVGVRFEGAIKRNIMAAPEQHDTGRMLNSIEFETQELGNKVYRVIAGTNVDYAIFQERLYPFVQPAFEEHGDWAMERFEEALENASDEVFG